MRRYRILWSMAAAVLVSSCAVNPPPPAQEIRKQALPNIALDGAWRADSSISTELVQDDWIKSFDDPVLDSLVREAIANNPDLRVAGARVEQAAQYLVVARSGLLPSLSIFGTGGAKSGGGGDTSSALQGVLLAASWELDLWGRLRYARNAAEQDLAAARADLEFARQSLAALTAKSWFTATQLSLDAAVATQMVQSANELSVLAQQRERVGAGTDADTAVARATAKEVESTLQQIQLSRGQALRALELLIGRYPAAEIAARADLLARPGPVTAGMPLQMLERRPDVIAAERRVAAAFNRVGEAKAARLPQLTLNASFGAFESEILQLREDFENPTGGIGARLLAPIYQGGALTAKVEIRTLQQKEAVADYARVALRAIGEVENAVAANTTLAARASLLGDALNEQTLALDLTQTRFRIGRADRRAVEQQRLTVSNARMALNSVRTDELAGRVNLHLALGGSFAAAAQ
ncbi:MAG TPA: efflux transporter outer membrane subunit [Steroidobacteraceae bacterium]|jgi:NodT family efflux transporter outer membrane factor (OMF) lipoprotein